MGVGHEAKGEHVIWDGLGYGVITLHYAYLLYLLVGGYVAWRWRWSIWLHIVAAGWAVLIVTTHVPCPLTAAQNQLRETGGRPPMRDSFINLYVQGTFYPHGYVTAAQLVLGIVVLVSWLGFWLRRHPANTRRHR